MSGPVGGGAATPARVRAGTDSSATRVCVVIPSRDCGALLPAALASVRAQTLAAARVVVVDDGSTDGTAELLAPAVARGELTLLRTPGAGPAAARNAGIRAAGEELVAFLDADDELEPDALRVLSAALAAEPGAGFCVCDVARIHPDRVEVRAGRPPDGDLLRAILRGNFIERAVLFRRRALLDAGLFDESLRILEDWELSIRLLAGGVRPAYAAGAWYRYVVRGGSLTRDLAGIAECKRRVLRMHHKRLADAGLPGLRAIYADQLWWLARHYLDRLHRPAAALGCVLEGLRYDPDPRRLLRAARTRLRETA